MPDCACGFGDGDWVACVDGRVYGPCGDARCTGVCEEQGPCECACHGAAGLLEDPDA